MRATIVILMIIAVVAICKACKYYINSLILAAWMAENEYAPPEDEDVKRLSSWVAQRLFKKD